ncbi:vWA domain-containing protein [Glycomyces xiaoerkulensis]|uniref:vWA domain-containing protein n=1 Tax=Glycomyces xiaoerkulensis TaxID=2038139 RepID=UPI000C2593EC|nr:substrate-binding domain-containing protein [Glycomyces xiaoerkulensis]
MSKEAHKQPTPTETESKKAKFISSSAGGVFAALGLSLALIGILSEGLTGSELEAMKVVAWILASLALVSLALRGGLWFMLERSGRPPPEFPPPHGNWVKRHRRSVSVSSIALVLAAAVLTILQDQLGEAINPDCPDPIELTVQVPSEGSAGFAQVVEAYASRQRDDRGCRTVSATALPVSWPETQAAYAAGWDADTVRLLGPRPGVWIAESAAQIDFVGGTAEEAAPLESDPIEIGSTPLVLAVPEGLDTGSAPAEAVFEALSGSDTGVVRPDPELSFTGLYHLNWLYQLDPPDSAIEDRIDAAFQRLGLGQLDENDLLCSMHQLGESDETGAVLTTERAMLLYNAAQMRSDCPQPSSPPALTALYPSDAGSLDYSAVRLGWDQPATADPAVEAERADAAEGFVRWLGEPEGREALAEVCIRVEGVQPVAPCSSSQADTDAELSTYGPEARRIEELLRNYGNARKPTRVLLAIDTSGSMAEQTGPNGTPLDEAAKVGAEAALLEFGPNDEFGVWAFPDDERMRPNELVDIGPADGDHSERARREIANLVPAGGTPLYFTIAEGVAELDSRDGDDVQSIMVVLTDGENDDQVNEVTLDGLAEHLSGTDVQLSAITVGEADCEKTGLGDLAQASRGRCLNVQARTLEDTFQELLDQIWGGDV